MTRHAGPVTPHRTVPLGAPWFDEHEERLVSEVLRSGWVTQGPVVERFEDSVAAHTGAAHAVAVTSATTGLFASLHTMGVGSGDEVICPSFTYIATVNAIRHTGATPVFVDVDPRHWAMDVDATRAAITSRTVALLPVHLWWAADAAALYDLARTHGLAVLEDAAPALGATYAADFGGRQVGNSDGPVVMSFHPRKVITTGEGGMVLTNDPALAQRLRLLRHHFMGISDRARHASSDVIFETYAEVGYNLRMSDVQAALGVAQMAKLGEIRRRRAAVADAYDAALSARQDVQLLEPLAGTEQAYQSYMLLLNDRSDVDRDELMRELAEHGITTRRGVMSVHLEEAHRHVRGADELPVSERLSRDSLLLPISPQMSSEDVRHVIGSVLAALG